MARQRYADALTGQGKPLGEFISLQLLADPTEEELARASELLREHRANWLGDIAPHLWEGVLGPGFRDLGSQFERGFLRVCSLHSNVRSEEHAVVVRSPLLRTIDTFRVLSLDSLTELTPLARCRALRHVEVALDLEEASVEVIRDFPHLRSLVLVVPDGTCCDALAELRELEDLELVGKTSLEPLRMLPQLRKLDIYNAVSDLSWLPSLTNLEELRIGPSQLGSLDPIRSLPKLRVLEIGKPENGPLDLEPLRHIRSLRSLSVTCARDIEPLGALHDLQVLALPESQVDLQHLGALHALRNVDLRESQILGSNVIANFGELETLDLAHSNICELTPLRGLSTLRSLNLWDTPVEDASPLATLGRLETLDLAGTRVSDLSPLSSLHRLRKLSLGGEFITGIEELASIPLRELRIRHTAVASLEPLRGMVSLENVDFLGTKVSDISPLTQLHALRYIDARDTEVADVRPLLALPKLRRLALDGSRVPRFAMDALARKYPDLVDVHY